MKILPVVRNLKSDLNTTGEKLKQAGSQGCEIGKRAANIYKQNELTKYMNVTRVISDKVIKSASIKELPYIAGAIGLFIPIPFASPIMMGVGCILKYSAPGIKKVINKIKK